MNYAARNGLLLSGFDRHAAHPAAAELRKAAENCLAVAQNFTNQRDELLRDQRYTADGKRTKLEELRAEATRLMGDACAPIDRAAKGGLERLRGQIKQVPVDPIPPGGVPMADYLKGLAAREEQLNGATLRELQALQPVVDLASAAAGVAHNDLS